MDMRIFFFIVLALLLGCKAPDDASSKAMKLLPTSVGAYISNYTKQQINVDEHILFRFSDAVVEASEIGNSVANNIFKIIPQVPGRAYWKDRSTLVFEPERLMDYDRDYKVEIQLKKLFADISEEYETISLTYRTNPFTLSVSLDDIEYGSLTNNNLLSVSGTIHTNNAIGNDALEKMIKVSQSANDKLVVHWNHHNKKHRSFSIENIERQKSESTVAVNWDASPYNKSQRGSKRLNVLPLGHFKVINAKVDQGDDKMIVVAFSGQLDRAQELTGLVTIPDSTKES